LKVVAVV